MDEVPLFERQVSLLLSYNADEPRDQFGRWSKQAFKKDLKSAGKRISKGIFGEPEKRAIINSPEFQVKIKKKMPILEERAKRMAKKLPSVELTRMIMARRLIKTKKGLIKSILNNRALKGKFFNIGGLSHQ